MKELSIEEKAKAYDDAIKKAESLYKAAEPMSGCNVIIETIFPELKESEDEQHRKWILEYLYNGLRKSDEQFKDHFKSAIAWLKSIRPQNRWKPSDEQIDALYTYLYRPQFSAKDADFVVSLYQDLKKLSEE